MLKIILATIIFLIGCFLISKRIKNQLKMYIKLDREKSKINMKTKKFHQINDDKIKLFVKKLKSKLNMGKSFQSINSITIYEINGKELSHSEKMLSAKFHVSNHWNQKDLVVISIENNTYTVSASDLKRAIDNAQNAHPY